MDDELENMLGKTYAPCLSGYKEMYIDVCIELTDFKKRMRSWTREDCCRERELQRELGNIIRIISCIEKNAGIIDLTS